MVDNVLKDLQYDPEDFLNNGAILPFINRLMINAYRDWFWFRFVSYNRIGHLTFPLPTFLRHDISPSISEHGVWNPPINALYQLELCEHQYVPRHPEECFKGYYLPCRTDKITFIEMDYEADFFLARPTPNGRIIRGRGAARNKLMHVPQKISKFDGFRKDHFGSFTQTKSLEFPYDTRNQQAGYGQFRPTLYGVRNSETRHWEYYPQKLGVITRAVNYAYPENVTETIKRMKEEDNLIRNFITIEDRVTRFK